MLGRLWTITKVMAWCGSAVLCLFVGVPVLGVTGCIEWFLFGRTDSWGLLGDWFDTNPDV